jgi:phosphopantetheine adenylyltransferase
MLLPIHCHTRYHPSHRSSSRAVLPHPMPNTHRRRRRRCRPSRTPPPLHLRSSPLSSSGVHSTTSTQATNYSSAWRPGSQARKSWSASQVFLLFFLFILFHYTIYDMLDDTLLKSKSYKEMIEPLAIRVEKVRAFLALFRPGLVYEIVPIHDVYGPTGWDPNIQALVVSKETLGGAKSGACIARFTRPLAYLPPSFYLTVADHRKSIALPPLQTFVIDVISTSSSNLDVEDVELLKRTKMSSTAIREREFENSNNGT